MNTFHTWMTKASPSLQQRMADEACAGSRAYLYQIKNGHRKAGVAVASAIVAFSKRFECKAEGLPIVDGAEIVADFNKHLFNAKEQA